MPRPVGSRNVGGIDVRSHTVTVCDEDWALLRAIGNGNASAGVRQLLEWWRARREERDDVG